MNDKELERKRYDERAQLVLDQENCNIRGVGAPSVATVLRAPYLCYENLLQKILTPDLVVLEMGSGTGEFSEILLNSGAKVVASDISEQSLALMRMRYWNKNNLFTEICDMENPSFADGMFDIVAMAGSLSYGDNQLVLSHIVRLLKPGGVFVCVDSLNHNPIYRINRYIHFLCGQRSFSTIKRMPTMDLIQKYKIALRGAVEAEYYFGGFSWLIIFFARLGLESFWASISDKLDSLFRVRKSAFKFVLVVRKDV